MIQTTQSPVSAGPKRRYVVIFNEGSGYVLIDYLSEGSYSVTMLVKSLQDGQTYVRKLATPTVITSEQAVNFMSDDERNIVQQSHVPNIIASRCYLDQVTAAVISRGAYTSQHQVATAATIWQFCNGGPVLRIFERWNLGGREKIHEAVLWKFLSSFLGTLLDIHKSGIVHGDIHQGNLLLHWPQNSSMPELFVADFGLSSRYPAIIAANFSEPFDGYGTFNQNGFPTPDLLSSEEVRDIGLWYSRAVADLRDMLTFFYSLIFAGRITTLFMRSDAVPAFFQEQARQGQGVQGYSLQLTQALVNLSNIVTAHWNHPPRLRFDLLGIHRTIERHSEQLAEQFMVDSAQAFRQTRWMREPARLRTPAIWKDPSVLFPSSDSVSPENSSSDNALRPHYRDGDDLFAEGPIQIFAGGHRGALSLRRGQFHVGEALCDLDTGECQPVRIIHSLDEVAPLSPDENSQANWSQNFYSPGDASPSYDGTASDGVSLLSASIDPRLHHWHNNVLPPTTLTHINDTTMTSSGARPNAFHNNDLPPTTVTHIDDTSMASPPPLATNPQAAHPVASPPNRWTHINDPPQPSHSGPFVNRWTHINDPPTSPRLTEPPLPDSPTISTPLLLPSDMDADTSLARHWRAYYSQQQRRGIP